MKKSFLRILSITVTLLLIVGMVMMPASAADPTTGTVRSGVATYRVTDAISAADGAFISSDSSVWKFAVGSLGDTFKASSADFTAPIAEAQVEGGLKLSWTVPEAAEGTTTLKVIGDNYNKTITVTGNSVILGDVVDGDTYQVQVTVGDVSSQILTYQNLINPITVTNYAGKEMDIFGGYNYRFADFIAHKDKIDENTGILFKIENITDDPDLMLTHYYNLSTGDYNGDGEADISGTYMPRAETTHKSLQGDVPFKNIVGASFSWRMESGYMNDENMYVQSGKEYAVDTTKTDRARYFYCYDNTILDTYASAKIKTFNNIQIAVSGVDDVNTTRAPFNTGYILVPFEAFSDEDIAELKETGVITLPTLGYYKYRAKNRLNALNAQGASNPDWTDVNIQQTSAYYDDTYPEDTAEEDKKIEAKVYYSEAAFINDYDAFVASCVDDTTTTIDSACLSSSTECKGTYLNTVAVSGQTYTLTDSSVASFYTDYVAKANGTTGKVSTLTYTTAAGEKMMLGFTAPATGTYEISAPITATAANGVHYRILKENVSGVKTVLQAEKTYAGEKHLVYMNADLTAGETVWFEAWADTAGTEINLGNPQFADITAKIADGAITYNIDSYGTTVPANSGTAGAWELGYFVNPFELNGEEKEYTIASSLTTDATIVHDKLGVKALAAVDDASTEDVNETDATTLYNALRSFDEFRFDGSPSSGNMASKYFRYGYNGTSFGVRNAVAGNGYTGTIYIYRTTTANTWTANYGFGFAAGSTYKNSWYNAGLYQMYTAVDNGTVALNLKGQETGGGKVLILQNSEVKYVYLGGKLPTEALEFDVAKGDEIIIVFAAIDDKENGQYVNYEAITETAEDGTTTNTISAKKQVTLQKFEATFTPDIDEIAEYSITFDGEIPSIMADKYDDGTSIVLPTTAKNGAIFQGWNDGTTTYKAGTAYTVKSDVAFTAEYIYYGNLDGDVEEKVTATDLTIMRQMLLKYTDIAGKSDVADITADIDANGDINLIDLVKMKKMSVGIETVLGAR